MSKLKIPLKGPFVIRHIKTNRVFSGQTVLELARKIAPRNVDRMHRSLGHVVTGRHLSAKGWFLDSILSRKISLRDVYGNVYRNLTLRELKQRFGIHPSSMLRLISGKRRVFRNMTLLSTPLRAKVAPRNWTISEIEISSNGCRAKGVSTCEVATKLGIHASNLYRLIYGFGDSSTIKIHRIKVRKKTILDI